MYALVNEFLSFVRSALHLHCHRIANAFKGQFVASLLAKHLKDNPPPAITFGAVVGLSGSIWALYQGFAHAAAVAPSPGISVAPTSGLVTTEAGGQATFQVNLNSRPKDTVSINLASDNPAQGTVSPSGASIFI